MKKTTRTIQTIIHPIYSHPTWFFYAFFIITLVVLSTNVGPELTVLAFCILNLITPLIASYLYKNFLALQETLNVLTGKNQQKWFSQQKALIFGVNTWSLLASFFVALGGLMINYYGVLWSGAARFFYFVHVVVLYSTVGTLGWAYVEILLFAFRAKNLKLNLEPLETKKEEIRKISTVYLGVFFTGVMLYLGATIAICLLPLRSDYAIFFFKFLIFPLAVIIAIYFLLIQYFLHGIMRKNKEIRLNKISLFIEKYYSKWKKSQLASHRATINDLLTWKNQIEKEKVFPFGFPAVAFALATVFLPIIILFFPAIKMIINSF